MSEHPIEGLMKATMDNLKDMIDVNTIIGDPVETNDGTVIIPISRVSMGFASGGSEFKGESGESQHSSSSSSKFPFGGGSGAGVSVQPVAFLIVSKEQIRLLPVEYSNPFERIVDSIPDVAQEIMNLLKRGKNINEPEQKEENVEYNPS